MWWPFKRRRKSTAKRNTMASDGGVEVSGRELPPINIRRWDGAKTTRLNRDYWQDAFSNTINWDLAQDLPTLRARCNQAIANNPIVEGVVNTLASDVAGKNGPVAQVESDDDAFNDAVEMAIADVMAMPDPDVPNMGAAEMIRMWVRSCCGSGDFAFQEYTADRERSVRTTLGLRCIESIRVDTPPELAYDQNVVFGVEMDDRGRTVRYHVRERQSAYDLKVGYKYEPIPPDMFHLNYRILEPGQARGVPWLASALPVIADVDQYDGYVMEAAKTAADNAVLMTATHPDAEFDFDTLPTEDKIKRGTTKYMTPGWAATTVEATQPTTQYVEYRHERLREFGRAFCMPLMMVLLSSADSNFASAHYDGQVYIRHVQDIQSWIARTTLQWIVKKIVREVSLSRATPSPRRYRVNWTWQVPPYVNPKDHYTALRMQLEDGMVDAREVMAAFGRDLDNVVASRQRYQQMLDSAELPPPPINLGSGGSVLAQNEAIENAGNGQQQPTAKPPRNQPARKRKVASR